VAWVGIAEVAAVTAAGASAVIIAAVMVWVF
jgi:hypothetical protein